MQPLDHFNHFDGTYVDYVNAGMAVDPAISGAFSDYLEYEISVANQNKE